MTDKLALFGGSPIIKFKIVYNSCIISIIQFEYNKISNKIKLLNNNKNLY